MADRVVTSRTRKAGKPKLGKAKPGKHRPVSSARAEPTAWSVAGISTDDPLAVVRQVRKGIGFAGMVRFQQATQLSLAEVSRFAAISTRTLARRRDEGRLQPDESDRLLRASRLFDMATELFGGDRAQARAWFLRPQPALNGETPLDFAGTEVGAREVENLIGRLMHGVFT